MQSWAVGTCKAEYHFETTLDSVLSRVIDLLRPWKEVPDMFHRVFYVLFHQTDQPDGFSRLLPADILDGLTTVNGIAKASVKQMVEPLKSKVVFSIMGSSEQHYGLSSGYVETGDEVVIAPALCDYLVVIRKREKPDTKPDKAQDSQMYRLVEFAYVDGLMEDYFEDSALRRRIREGGSREVELW